MWAQLEAGGYFKAAGSLPPVLAAVRAGGAGQAAAAHALGGCVSHLRDVLLDKQVRGWVGGLQALLRGCVATRARPCVASCAGL